MEIQNGLFARVFDIYKYIIATYDSFSYFHLTIHQSTITMAGAPAKYINFISGSVHFLWAF